MQLRAASLPLDDATAPAGSIFAPDRLDARAPAEVVAASQIQRLLYGVTSCIAERGFAATTIEAITTRAGVSKKTFYEHFANKLACFLAAYDYGVEGLLRMVNEAGGEAVLAGRPPAEVMRAWIRATLEFLVVEEPYARTFFVEVLPLGQEAARHRSRAHESLTGTIRAFREHARRSHPEWPDIPDGAYEATLMAMHGLIATYVAEGRTRELPELEPIVLYIHCSLLAIPPA